MKILAIRGANLTSLAGAFAVELEQPPLGESGLFAITGPTGAGKSTLLDALCVSLYGRIPRLENVGAAILIGNEERDALAHNDPRNLLRRGAASCFAETEYRGLDGKVYLARWSVERISRGKNKGVLKPAETSLRDLAEDRLIGRTKNEVLQAVHESLGLNFDQFRRSVLLAQGDFAAFLKAGNKARADLLERMTGTEIYSRIGAAAYERAKHEQQQFDLLESRLGDTPVLSEEARTAHQTQKDQLEKSRSENTVNIQKCKTRLEWIKQQQRLENHVEAAVTARREHQQALQDFEPQQTTLAQITRAEPLRPIQQRERELQERLNDLTNRRQEAEKTFTQIRTHLADHQTKLAALQNQLAVEQQQLKDAQPDLQAARRHDHELSTQQQKLAQIEADHEIAETTLAALETQRSGLLKQQDDLKQRHQHILQSLEEEKEAQPLCDQWHTWQQEIEQLVANQRESRELDQQQQTWQQEEQTFRKQVDAAESQQQAAKKQLADLEEHLRQQERDVHPEDGPRVQKAVEETLTVIHWIQGAQARHHSLQKLETQLGEKEEKYALLVNQGKEAAGKAENAAGALTKVQIQLEEARATLDRLRLTHSENLSQLRGMLQTDEPCPLCGATDHPYRDQQPADALLGDQEQHVKALANDQQRMVQQEQAAKTQLQHLREQARSEQREIKQRRSERQQETAQLEELWRNKPALLSLQWSTADNAEQHQTDLKQHLAEAETQLETLRRRQNDLRDLDQKLADTRKHLADQRSRYQSCDEHRRKLAEQERDRERQRLERDHRRSTLTQQGESTRARLSPMLVWLKDWQAVLQEDPPSLLEHCAKRVDQLRRHHQEAGQTVEALKTVENTLQPLAHECAVATTRRDSLQQQRREGSEALATTRAKRAELLNGEPVQQVLQRLEGAVDTTNKACLHQQSLVSQAERDHASQDQKRTSLQEQYEEVQKAHQQNQVAWREQCAVLDCSETQALEWLAVDPSWIEETQKQSTALQQQFRDSDLLLGERRQALESHKQERPDGDFAEESVEALAETLTHLEQAQQTCIEQYFAVKNILDQDRKTQAQRHDLLAQREKQQQVIELWEAMRSLIGSKDGNKFRQYAQSLTLDSLLGYANVHLDELARRYRLARVPHIDTLELQIIDRDMADEARSINSLSGGETFLVSLALALGLASMSAERSLVESLFIDEGFGALDPESLDLALSALDSLQAMGRQVGVISHIPTLIERIGTRICVTPQGAGRSMVRVEDAAATG